MLDGAGEPIDPVVVQAGDLSLLLFEVDEISDRGFSVRARSGGSRQLAAVIGSGESVDHVADVIAERGLLNVVARFRSITGTGAAVTWVPADHRNRSRDRAAAMLPTAGAAAGARPDTQRTGPFADVVGGRR